MLSGPGVLVFLRVLIACRISLKVGGRSRSNRVGCSGSSAGTVGSTGGGWLSRVLKCSAHHQGLVLDEVCSISRPNRNQGAASGAVDGLNCIVEIVRHSYLHEPGFRWLLKSSTHFAGSAGLFGPQNGGLAISS